MEEIQISAVVITFNEEKRIETCLRSLMSVADEIVVVDSYSTDQTKRICEDYGVRFIEHPFSGYIEQKNFAARQAKYNYILSLDADEVLSDSLQYSIAGVKKKWIGQGYTFKRLNRIADKWIHFGNWSPDIKLRLWQKGAGTWGGTDPHDRFEFYHPRPKPILLKGHLLHYSYESVTAFKRKNREFAEIAAEAMFRKGVRVKWWKRYGSGFFRWFKGYILKLGFLDGKMGWMIAYGSMKEVNWKYKILAEKWKTL
ncbi:MAG: glycosyltransferase family 2 protein [Saprospiraceae bacterium]|jgi:glycosyltransferase involved in cell wall biosynthesis